MTSRSAAPGRLELVRAFVNTRNIEAGTDVISTPDDLAGWLGRNGMLAADEQLAAGQVQSAIAIREAVRAALAANHDGAPAPTGAQNVLNDAARRSKLSLSFTDAGWSCTPNADGFDAAMGTLLAIIVTAMTDHTWSRLKACRNDTCQWAFYDTSRARTGKWCTMRLCGNRAKQLAWRQRRTAAQR